LLKQLKLAGCKCPAQARTSYYRAWVRVSLCAVHWFVLMLHHLSSHSQHSLKAHSLLLFLPSFFFFETGSHYVARWVSLPSAGLTGMPHYISLFLVHACLSLQTQYSWTQFTLINSFILLTSTTPKPPLCSEPGKNIFSQHSCVCLIQEVSFACGNPWKLQNSGQRQMETFGRLVPTCLYFKKF
jgi:hypothetical protein